MMDPEMIRLAQEQMSRIPPDELLRMQQQMMSNPNLMRMATEGMKNIRPQDLRFAAEQMKNMPAEQIADMSARMANVTPEQISAMSAQKDYQYQGALMLKNQGNQLHANGQYQEAVEKYSKAKENLAGATSPEASSLRLTCSLNLMSCYLKMTDYDRAVMEGTEVLSVDPRNLKALYRRGQAYKELHQLDRAVADLTEAAAIAQDDETVAEVLQQAKDELERRGCSPQPNQNGPIIEEITDEEAERLTQTSTAQSNTEDVSNRAAESSDNLTRETSTSFPGMSPQTDHAYADALKSMKQNPELIRNMQSMMSSVEPEQIAAMSGGSMTPEMAKFAADLMKYMSPADMERMVDMASGMTPAAHSGMTPAQDTASSSRQPEITPPQPLATEQAMPSDQLRRQMMKDPGMKEMMSSMIKSMSPEAMASMSQQFGYKMTPEQAVEAQKAMASISPDQLDKVMRWAERAQMASEQLSRAKSWILGKQGLLLAILMLLVAVLLHYFGFIGN